VGDGSDIIKFYADYRRKVMRFPQPGANPQRAIRFLPERPNPAVPLYTQEEMDAIVSEARLAEIPVSAHAGETRAALMAAKAGVTSVEHIFEDTDDILDDLLGVMKQKGTIWVPTLATTESYYPPTTGTLFQKQKAAVKTAHDRGVRLAAGGDTGTFDHGLNVREMEIMMECGISVEDVLEAGTVAGWEACGGDQCGFRFGWFEKGARADIIALETDPRADKRALRKVSFVMKDGQVWKQNGHPVASMIMGPAPTWPSSEGESDSTSSEEWTDLISAQPRMAMSVPSPVFGGSKSLSGSG
jgi:imidazolonepropionase-like amidohydrolase